LARDTVLTNRNVGDGEDLPYQKESHSARPSETMVNVFFICQNPDTLTLISARFRAGTQGQIDATYPMSDRAVEKGLNYPG